MKPTSPDGHAAVPVQRGRGRPRVEQPLQSLSMRLTPGSADYWCRRALKSGLSTSEVLRLELERRQRRDEMP